jgi:predicted small metal-binding protein
LLTSLPVAVVECKRKAEAKHAAESVEDIVRHARAVS